MAGRTRRLVWAEGARRSLDQVLAVIAEDSPIETERFLEVVLRTAQTLSSLGALWPNVDKSFRSYSVRISAKFFIVSLDGIPCSNFGTWDVIPEVFKHEDGEG